MVTAARPKTIPSPIPACANPRPVKTSEKRPIFRSARRPINTAATAKLRKNQWPEAQDGQGAEDEACNRQGTDRAIGGDVHSRWPKPDSTLD